METTQVLIARTCHSQNVQGSKLRNLIKCSQGHAQRAKNLTEIVEVPQVLQLVLAEEVYVLATGKRKELLEPEYDKAPLST